MSVKFKTPITGNNVRYVKAKRISSKIRFTSGVNGEKTRKMNDPRADIVEERYILAEAYKSKLKCIFFVAINK